MLGKVQRFRLNWTNQWTASSLPPHSTGLQISCDRIESACGFVVGHIAPEAFVGGLLAIIKNGDMIEINTITQELNLKISKKEITARFSKWKKPKRININGVLSKYSKLVSQADTGAVTIGSD
jgi:dihydroxyacid dehydratase/phosphogluconate dehydratase